MTHVDDASTDDIDDTRAQRRYGEIIAVFQIGRVKVVQRYACIRRDQFEFTTSTPFPPAFREYLSSRGVVRGTDILYTLDVPHEFQLTVAPNARRAVFVPRLSTELKWQKNVVTEIVSALDATLLLG